jgi:hypothetical protein
LKILDFRFDFMASNYSFDVVSDFDRQEVVNAVDQTIREIKSRYDLKDTKTTVELNENSTSQGQVFNILVRTRQGGQGRKEDKEVFHEKMHFLAIEVFRKTKINYFNRTRFCTVFPPCHLVHLVHLV